jgi:signal peptidase I
MWRKVLRVLVWVAIGCAVIAALTYAVFDPWTIPGDDPQLNASIEPTLSAGDVVLVTRSKGATDGALVRCADPDAAGRFVIGRVVAHSGDTIEMASSTLIVNGKPSTASVACDPAMVHIKNPATQEEEELSCLLEDQGGGLHPILRSTKIPSKDFKKEVEPGKSYLLSDNRVMHLDSRDYMGVVPSSCQRVALRLWGAQGWLDTRKRLTILW